MSYIKWYILSRASEVGSPTNHPGLQTATRHGPGGLNLTPTGEAPTCRAKQRLHRIQFKLHKSCWVFSLWLNRLEASANARFPALVSHPCPHTTVSWSPLVGGTRQYIVKKQRSERTKSISLSTKLHAPSLISWIWLTFKRLNITVSSAGGQYIRSQKRSDFHSVKKLFWRWKFPL